MDERHWWIADKIQETFQIGGLENPTQLEEFMCDADTLKLVDRFLSANGLCKLFFYWDKSSGQLKITGCLSTVKGLNLETMTVLFMLRKNVAVDIEAMSIERDVFSGELKGSLLANLSSALSEIYLPQLKARKDWGQCSGENQQTFLQSVEKLTTTLTETVNSSPSYSQLVRSCDSLPFVKYLCRMIVSVITCTSISLFISTAAANSSESGRW